MNKGQFYPNKILKDCIYGHITIPDICVAFMDVPEFQRLRRVKQLGTSDYAYPSATYTRFEHSLGVMYLAGNMVDQLRKYVDIDNRTKELIQLTGMYHDIGHFAYSHLFDMFLSMLKDKDKIPEIFRLHDHEDRSIYFLNKVNKRLCLLTDEEEIFVANVIMGHIPPDQPNYLYQIVCNQECGIDIDKQDYLRRDSFHNGFPAFQSDYIILNAVVDKDGNIAYKNKAYNDINNLYRTRHNMFENVYQHHTSLKMYKIYFCMMKRLGLELFKYGERTDDYNIETLFRNSTETADLISQIDSRNLDHECDICSLYHPIKRVTVSGIIDNVRFLDNTIKGPIRYNCNL